MVEDNLLRFILNLGARMARTSTIPIHSVSVIIPCYNGHLYLHEAIDSVLDQTYPNIELIVVDDGSTDNSWEIIQSYKSRITGVKQHNQGLPASRNNGVARASGEYLFFLDCDDLIAPDTIASLVTTVQGQDRAISCCHWRSLVHSKCGWIAVPGEVPFPQTNPDPLAAWLMGEWIPVCSLLWSRSLFEELGGYDNQLTINEDGDLMFRALVGGARLVVATGGESFYRRHGTDSLSMSRDVFSEHRFQSSMRVLAKLEAELQHRGTWEKYRIPVGTAYQMLAARTFSSRPDLAREALQKGKAYAGRQAVAATRLGRILVKALGLERKQQLVEVLAKFGILTRGRRELIELRKLARANNMTPPSKW
jgi:O-antigen biosynthesis protein